LNDYMQVHSFFAQTAGSRSGMQILDSPSLQIQLYICTVLSLFRIYGLVKAMKGILFDLYKVKH